MPKLTKPGNITLDKLKDNLSISIGSKYKLLLNGSRLEVIGGSFRGCVVKVERRGEQSNIFFGPFIPSTGLAVVMSIISVGSAAAIMAFVNFILGVILLPASMLLRLAPSSGVVNEVKKELEKI